MPILEYRCNGCGHVTEILTALGEEPGADCEDCGSEDTEKLFSAFSAQVKQSAPAAKCDTCPSGGTCPMR